MPEGSTFCEYCGGQARSERRERIQRSMPAERYFYNPSYVDDGYEAAVQPKSNSTITIVLVGAAIGIAILMLVFAMMFFLKNNEEQDDTSDRMIADLTSSIEYAMDRIDSNNDKEDRRGHEPRETYHTNNNYYYNNDTPKKTTNNYYNEYHRDLYDIDQPLTISYDTEYYITENDIYGMTNDELQKAINDIYAKYGLIFETDEIQAYYEEQPEYDPWTRSDSEVWNAMSECDQHNISFLKNHKSK